MKQQHQKRPSKKELEKLKKQAQDRRNG